MTPLLIFTDIDGTLIDFATYSFTEAADTVKEVLARHIPLILCSSKTRAEQESLRQVLAIPDPFIVENGSAIFIPPGTFPIPFAHRWVTNWQVIELGVAAATIQAALVAVRQETGLVFQGYADLSTAEVAHHTGLTMAAAAHAQHREYSETIVTPLSSEALTQLEAALAQRGLTIVSGGKFYTVMGAHSDKGRAVTHLTALYRQKLGNIVTIGLGDSANDRPLLMAVDRPYLVQKPDGTWQAMDGVAVEWVAAAGPSGWQWVVEREISHFLQK
jgi:mannosyl-3-phosphoglycerate phosphatase family protein